MDQEKLKKEYEQYVTEIKDIQTQLDCLPDGIIFCARNGKNYKWYQTDHKTQTYIPKDNRPYAEKLALRKFLTYRLEELSKEKYALELYLRHVPRTYKSIDLLKKNDGYRELLQPFFTPLSEELREWAASPYEQNQKFPEYLLHKTSSGNLVRSKSEAMIDMVLYSHKIPFRYECKLTLGNSTLYPDFTIRHPKTGELFYWEHFGMMDDPIYSKSVGSKLQLYISFGIIPSINLITTFETADKPLSSEKLEKIIADYFL